MVDGGMSPSRESDGSGAGKTAASRSGGSSPSRESDGSGTGKTVASRSGGSSTTLVCGCASAARDGFGVGVVSRDRRARHAVSLAQVYGRWARRRIA